MMKLQEILDELDIDYTVYGQGFDLLVEGFNLDSRKLTEHEAFVAVQGTQVDGHRFIPNAIAKGVRVVFCECLPDETKDYVNYVVCKDLKENLVQLAQAMYGNPSEELNLVGVTGTNGKTTIATIFYRMLRIMGLSCGLLSTVKICIDEEVIPSELTTPDVFTLFKYLRRMCDAGCAYAIMEVSSHAIDQNRIQGLEFRVAAFTNISHDHLDYHKTFKSYIYTKKRLFDQLGSDAYAITNADDRNGMVMVQESKAKLVKYAMRSSADVRAKLIEHDFSGMHMLLDGTDFFTPLVGRFNVYNLLAVVAICDCLGFERMEILPALSGVRSAAGRFEIVRDEKRNVTAIVDYAHTPDALENVLSTIHQVNRNRGKIITVVGCGGDRDRTKRPKMAKIACDYSQYVVLTSDNPRTEDPEAILSEMEQGLVGVQIDNVEKITNRKSAIQRAIKLANNNDVILVAGKGHENYQEINGVRTPFDDKKIVQEFLTV